MAEVKDKASNVSSMSTFEDTTSKDYPRTPLRYPGGKSRAIKHITPLIPKDTQTLCSPFFGGGSIELACTSKGINVKGYDVFEPVVNFWQCLLSDPLRLADKVRHDYYPLKRLRFYELQKRYASIRDKIERAAVFYVLNRSSFSGTTLSGGMSPEHPRFTPSSIDKLKTLAVNNLSIEQMCYTASIPKHRDDFLYLDPPYLNGQKLYGLRGDTHTGFDHKTLKELLDKRDRWILSYNDCATIRAWYKDYQILRLDWTYGMNTNKQSNEIVVLSHDLTV